MTPMDRLILRAVRCVTCGAPYGGCDCSAKRAAERERERDEFIRSETEKLMQLPDDELIAEARRLGVDV